MIFKGINIIGSFDPSQIAGRILDIDPARVDTSTGFVLYDRANSYSFGATGTPNPEIVVDTVGKVFSLEAGGGYVTSLKRNGDKTLPIVKDPVNAITLYIPYKQISSGVGAAAFINIKTGNDIAQNRISFTINFASGVVTPANRPLDGGTNTTQNISTTFDNEWNLLVFKVDLVANNWRVYKNGTQINSRSTINGGSTVYDDTDALQTNIGFTACDVRYYRLFLYSGAHDDVTRGKIEQWYKRKGITAIA